MVPFVVKAIDITPHGTSIMPAPILDSNGNIIDRPSWVILSGNAGETLTGELVTFNFDSFPRDVIVLGMDSATSQGGGFALASSDSEQFDIGKWATVEPSKFTISPNSTSEISFTLTIPNNATAGLHTGGFTIEDDLSNPQDNVSTHTRVGVRVYLTVLGLGGDGSGGGNGGGSRGGGGGVNVYLTTLGNGDNGGDVGVPVPVSVPSGGEGSVSPPIPNVNDTYSWAITSSDMLKNSKVPFIDLTDDWSRPYINKLYLYKIVIGRSKTKFEPNSPITRAEMVKIALRVFGYKIGNTMPSFKDTKKQSWYSYYISTAQNATFIEGFNDGNFKPEQSVTRAEALKILFKAAKINVTNSNQSQFKDVPVDSWFATYINFAYEKGVIQGKSKIFFAPNESITRAEGAKIAIKIKNLIH